MPEQRELVVDPARAVCVVDQILEILELAREGVRGERFRVRERFTIGADAAAREIEGHGVQSVLRQ
jgi:hypothetical protein